MKRPASILALSLLWLCGSLWAATAAKRLTLEQVGQEGAIVSPGIERLRWRPGHEQITYLRTRKAARGSGESLQIYDVATWKARTLVDAGDEKLSLDLDSYRWSPDGKALLFQGQNDLWLFEVASGNVRRLTKDPESEEYPTFSPTGDRIAFVKTNNIYALDLASGHVEQLTTDGSKDILNGKFDWVYKEELANRATGRAYEWSPDGHEIAYLRLDDRPVPVYPLTHYLHTHVELIPQRFPQAGDPNPVPSFHVVEVGGEKPQRWTFPMAKTMNVEYLGPEFSWTLDSKSVAFLTLNRSQTVEAVHLWNPAAGGDRVLVTEKDPYWINSLDAPYFLKDDRRFLWLSERDGWLHLYLYRMDGELLSKETRGDWMLDHLLFSGAPMFQVDEKSGWIYFSSTHPDLRQRQLYRVRLDGSGMERLSREDGTHALDLSPGGRFLIDTYSNYQTPPQVRLLHADGEPIATLDKPENHLDEYDVGATKFVQVRAPDGATLDARLVLPPDFDPEKKYPVIVYVYGGPHVQLIRNEWGVTSLFDLFLAQEGYIVWTLDGRGSWGRGHAWESVIFENMGRHELADQLTGVKYLESLPYVDAKRLGIWGWSYGGYMTLYTLTHAPDVFKCGAAGGPVSDWKFYDSIYTERYMRTPAENPQGYEESSPLEAASRLKAKVLLIHGADDDNVHMQNTMNFINALVQAHRSFELYIQPGQKHGFIGNTVRTYLYERLFEFFQQYL